MWKVTTVIALALLAFFLSFTALRAEPPDVIGGPTGWCTDSVGHAFRCREFVEPRDREPSDTGSAEPARREYRAPRRGEPHPRSSHVIWDGNSWVAEPGYRFVDPSNPNNLHTEKLPFWYTPDPFSPYELYWDGHGWATIQRPRLGQRHPTRPHLVWDGVRWQAEPGYRLINPSNPGDLRVESLLDRQKAIDLTPGISYGQVVPAGERHPQYPHVVSDGRSWQPEQGWVWATSNPEDLRTRRAVDPLTYRVWPANLTAFLNLPADRPLGRTLEDYLVSLPGTNGYPNTYQRTRQLAKLSDEQLIDSIARLERRIDSLRPIFRSGEHDLALARELALDAEDAAYTAALHLLDYATDIEWSKFWEVHPDIKRAKDEMIEEINKEREKRQETDPSDTDWSKRRNIREKLIHIYEKLRGVAPQIITQSGLSVIKFADALIEYSYQVARWELAVQEINSVSGNISTTLDAQKALKRLQEDLITERNNRRQLHCTGSAISRRSALCN